LNFLCPSTSEREKTVILSERAAKTCDVREDARRQSWGQEHRDDAFEKLDILTSRRVRERKRRREGKEN